MQILVDASMWPVVQLSYPAEITSDDVIVLGERLMSLHRARGPMVLLCELDGLAASNVTPLLRKCIADEADSLAKRGALVAESIVVKSPLLRGIYRAYTWARRRPVPAAVFGERSLALAWAREQIAPRVQHQSMH